METLQINVPTWIGKFFPKKIVPRFNYEGIGIETEARYIPGYDAIEVRAYRTKHGVRQEALAPNGEWVNCSANWIGLTKSALAPYRLLSLYTGVAYETEDQYCAGVLK